MYLALKIKSQTTTASWKQDASFHICSTPVNMREKIKLLRLFGLFIIGLGFLNFVRLGADGKNPNDSLRQQARQTVERQFREGLKELKSTIDRYQAAAETLTPDKESLKALRAVHLETRLTFKKIEFLLEYFDPASVKRYLNGAPLPAVESKVPEIRVLDPIGLQVLDEMAFGEDLFLAKEEIKTLTTSLVKDFDGIYNYQIHLPIRHRHVFEGVRQELVRVLTLGVTGFDTPGSVNALPEAQVAVESIAAAFEAYYPLVANKDVELAQKISRIFKEGIAYLEQNGDFNSFNRLVFLKQYINPLYRLLYQAHKKTGVEFVDEVNDVPQAFNYHAENIFADNFLNATYFSGFNIEKAKRKGRVALGRMLFFDPVLSGNNQRSCASCHQPELAFTDGLPKSLAANGEDHLLRNSPTIINAVFAERYFYDLREEALERQVKHVILDKSEFNTDFFEIEEKLNQSEEYKALFAEAYPEYRLSRWSVSNALASYVASLNSFNSPFDRYVRGESRQISPAVERGFNLFMGKAACATCHFAPSFSGLAPPNYRESESEILGVPVTKDTLSPVLDTDPGRIQSSRMLDEAPFYAHSFKTTTVRNSALTAPYMHNGVYESLEEVIDFYNRGGGAGLGIDTPYQTLPDAALNLDKTEIKDLIAFLESLTDTTGLTQKPARLPRFDDRPEWNARRLGGRY